MYIDLFYVTKIVTYTFTNYSVVCTLETNNFLIKRLKAISKTVCTGTNLSLSPSIWNDITYTQLSLLFTTTSYELHSAYAHVSDWKHIFLIWTLIVRYSRQLTTLRFVCLPKNETLFFRRRTREEGIACAVQPSRKKKETPLCGNYREPRFSTIRFILLVSPNTQCERHSTVLRTPTLAGYVPILDVTTRT